MKSLLQEWDCEPWHGTNPPQRGLAEFQPQKMAVQIPDQIYSEVPTKVTI